jgi:hypothetical protein
MRLATGLLAAVLLLIGMAPSQAVVRIADDRGGRIGTYVDKYQGLRTSGEAVIIDGLCASACTIVLGAIPHDRICVTSHATLGFHAAWDFGTNGRAITNPEATQMLYSMYPSPVKRWIMARGGLTPHMIFLRGKELQTLFKPCYLDAQASAPKTVVGAPPAAGKMPARALVPATQQASVTKEASAASQAAATDPVPVAKSQDRAQDTAPESR